jgi:beta-galactosidase
MDIGGMVAMSRCQAALLLWGCCGFLSLHAQQTTRLTSHWEFLRQDLGGVWEAVRPVGNGTPDNVPIWTAVTLPHCVNATDAVDPTGNYYQGPSWYRTQLEIRNPYSKGRTVLHFEGAGQKTQVYIYTTLVGSHTGGYDEWSVDVTEAVEAFRASDVCRTQFKGKIPLSIRTDNSRDLEMIPSNLADFTVYGGLYRYVDLVYAPAVSIDRVFATPTIFKTGASSSGNLMVRARLYAPGVTQALVFAQLYDPQGQLVGACALTPDTLGEIPVPAKRLWRWSPNEPLLYTLVVKAVSGGDTAIDREKIGFRSFTFLDHGPFLLNEQRLLLRGTHRHEDQAGVGAAMTEDMTRKELILIKEMGVNFIRLAHYQQSSIVLNLCDSLGILVWEEEPWCRGGLGGPVYQAQARNMLTHMIEQHFNHPAVIIWGLGNENDWPGDFPVYEKDSIRAFMRAQNDLAHALDPGRKTAIRRCDFCSDIPDVYSPSIWDGWYRGIYTEYKSTTDTAHQKYPHFLHMEWGGDSHAGRHSENPDQALSLVRSGTGADERLGDAALFGGAARVSKDGDWSETYICNLVDWYLREQETMPWLTGSAAWIFKDFATPGRPENPVPYVNEKGAVERDLTPKEVYYVFQSYWATVPMVHIYGHSWPVRWGDSGALKMVKVYSNCAQAELWVNGKSYGVRHRDSQDFPAAGLHWLVHFEPGENTLRVVARGGVSDSIHFVYQTAKWGKPSKLIAEQLKEAGDTATVQVTLVDDKGVLCLDAADWVHFGLSGDGRLLDNLGTPSGSRVVQLSNGRALIRVKENGGKSVVSVASEDRQTVFVSLASRSL